VTVSAPPSVEPEPLTAARGAAERTATLAAAEGLPVRVVVATAFPALAAAIMIGGSFSGAGGRVYSSLAVLLGIGVGVLAARARRTWQSAALIAGGLAAIGLMMVVPSGLGSLSGVRSLVAQAASSREVLRPPVALTAGWQAILGWLMGTVGFLAAWVGIALRRPSLAVLLPMPVAAIGGISVPRPAQIGSGMAVLVMLAAGIAVLASAETRGDDDEPLPVGYELRRAVRAVPLVGAITAGLFLLAKASFLFPHPYIDPTQEPQKPKTVPLSDVQDRVLFEVDSSISGPWRIGSLDVYDGRDWRLPPFAEGRLRNVPRSGVVDRDLVPGVKATFTVAGLGGAVLPGLPNTVGIVAEGPRLAYDARSGNIRVAQGQVQAGLRYTVAAASLPTVEALKAVGGKVTGDIARLTDIADPPPKIRDLISRAPKGSKWEEFDSLRGFVLDTVTATGQGVPKGITPDRVEEMLFASKEGSPFEIVAAQAMIARWVGLPSRIGYGFDGGETVNGKLQVRPRHGATFVEVYFPRFKWLPIIGAPKKARATVANPDQQQFDPNVLPSEDIAVELFLPAVIAPRSRLLDNIRLGVLVAVLSGLVLLLAYATYPAARKAWLRSRRRSAAAAAGPRSRIELAYAEWRDALADFGYAYRTDTPLMLLDRFVPDSEHTELAWLVTRTIWGDLRHQITDELAAAAEELSRTLRRRLAQAQPATMRAIAIVSRASLRDPYHPGVDLLRREHAA
jgi:hypothetical protein